VNVGPVGHEPADLPVVPARRETARDDDEDPLPEALDLLEDVAREQDRSPVRGHRPKQVHHVQPLARVHAVERLVEDEDGRVVDESARDLDPLPHPLRVAPDRAVGDVFIATPRSPAHGTPRASRSVESAPRSTNPGR
jgi:hypothetical protein